MGERYAKTPQNSIEQTKYDAFRDRGGEFFGAFGYVTRVVPSCRIMAGNDAPRAWAESGDADIAPRELHYTTDCRDFRGVLPRSFVTIVFEYVCVEE